MSQTTLNLEQAINALLNAATIAQKRGAFTLAEASTLHQAHSVVEQFQTQQKQKQQALQQTSSPQTDSV